MWSKAEGEMGKHYNRLDILIAEVCDVKSPRSVLCRDKVNCNG